MGMAERLQELRKNAGYSQEQVAEMLGLSRQAISKWESGQGKPEIDNILKLMEIYKVSADYILLGKETAQRDAAEKEAAEKENASGLTKPEKKELSHEYKITIGIIAVIAATAVITVLFITALGLLSRFGI